MAHQIVIVPEGYSVIEQTYGYWSFGPARKLHFLCWTWPGCGEEISTTSSIPEPKQADNSLDWLSRSRVWYTQLPDRILNPIQRTLLNQEV